MAITLTDQIHLQLYKSSEEVKVTLNLVHQKGKKKIEQRAEVVESVQSRPATSPTTVSYTHTSNELCVIENIVCYAGIMVYTVTTLFRCGNVNTINRFYSMNMIMSIVCIILLGINEFHVFAQIHVLYNFAMNLRG